jgi:DNA-binding MarR family transcriptional regulator
MEDTVTRQIEGLVGSCVILASVVRRVIEQRVLEETAGETLTESQLKILRIVSLSQARRLGEVAAFLGISNAAASKAVDKLVSRMLLRRVEGEGDRRSVQISLTGPARRLLEIYDRARRQKLREAFAGFSEEEMLDATEVLNRFTGRILGRESESPEVCFQCGMYFPERCVVREHRGRSCEYRSLKEESELSQKEESIS